MNGKLSQLWRRRAEGNVHSRLSATIASIEGAGLTQNSLQFPESNTSPAKSYTIDRPSFCQRCNEHKYPMRVLDVIEGRTESVLLSWLAFDPDMDLSCPFCKILECARRDFKEYPRYDGAYFYLSTDSGLFATKDDRLRVLRISKDFRISVREPPESCALFASEFQEAKGRSHIDLSVFQRHIQTCLTTHKTCNLRNPNDERVVGLKVIDCQSGDVVSASDDCQYATLSYVWGTQATGDLRDPPKTISDAMAATLGLGLQFLWVDRYCISQDSQEEKHAQIQQMGLIYVQAQVTLVAAAGKDPSHGLPGITARNSKRDFVARIGRFDFNMMHKTPHELLLNAVWNTRGWTYQEFILSRRILFFTEELAFLECQTSMIEEWPASTWKHSYVLFPPPDMKDNADRLLSLNEDLMSIRSAYTAIQRYSKRKLTYHSDALNGILGILARFEHASPPVHHLWGLPYELVGGESRLPLDWWCSIDDDKYFRCAKAIVTRRKNLPSWSWTGWEGVPSFDGLEYPHLAEPDDGQMNFSMDIEAHLETSEQPLTLEGFVALMKVTPFGARQRVSQCLHINGWTHPLEIDKEYNPLESDFYGPRIRLLGTDYDFTATKNAAFSAGDIQKGIVERRNLKALFIHTTRVLVIGDTPIGTERLGIADICIGFPRESRYSGAAVDFIQQLPLAKMERIRLY